MYNKRDNLKKDIYYIDYSHGLQKLHSCPMSKHGLNWEASDPIVFWKCNFPAFLGNYEIPTNRLTVY